MTRFLLGILFFVMSFAIIAEQYLVIKSPLTSVVAVEDPSDSSDEESTPAKEKKAEYEEDCFLRYVTSSAVYLHASLKTYSTIELLLPSGYLSSPFTPPDLM